jgi:hypothetical protein
MTMPEHLNLTHLTETNDLEHLQLPANDETPPWSIQLAGVEGATAVDLELVDEGGAPRLRAEIECHRAEPFTVRIGQGREGRLLLECPGHRVRLVPIDSGLELRLPLRPQREATRLDLVVVVDGTTRVMAPEDDGRREDRPLLLADSKRWAELVGSLIEIAEGLCSHHEDMCCAVLAFGDHRLNGVSEPGLDPRYLLSPSSREQMRLDRLSMHELEAGLRMLEPTPGLDQVDALAEALEACLGLPWREGSRRIAVVLGDSPGYSLLRPAPVGADVNLRGIDVDTAALALHDTQVEIVTIHHGPLPESTAGDAGHQRELIEHCRTQYRSLATLGSLAVTAQQLDPAALVARLMEGPELIARGASVPKVLSVS